MQRYIDVILPLPLPATFTYALTDEMVNEVQVGCRVVVPFGRKKYYTAIVQCIHNDKPTDYEVKNAVAVAIMSMDIITTIMRMKCLQVGA